MKFDGEEFFYIGSASEAEARCISYDWRKDGWYEIRMHKLPRDGSGETSLFARKLKKQMVTRDIVISEAQARVILAGLDTMVANGLEAGDPGKVRTIIEKAFPKLRRKP